jgi:hypothetical protein
MKSKLSNKELLPSLLAVIVLGSGIFVFAAETNGQTTRRRSTLPQPTASPTPRPQTNVPEVISRANDYLTSEQIINPSLPTPENTEPQTEPEEESETERLNKRIKELNSRIQTLEGSKQNQYDQKQKRLLLNMDILSRAEQRAESLRKQLFETIDKESSIQTRIDQLSYDLRPEMLERVSAFAGSLRPEEIRETRRKTLESEKRNLENLLTQIQTSRLSLEENLRKADLLVDKVRLKLEKEIDDALVEEPENQNPQ